ncbi:MAG: hypothetical protein IJB44_06640 [Clostridia bacterium]|nr:hypothetical protein [Clostridia bacterium]
MAEYQREADKYVKDKWYKNIWYHYKIPICLIGFFAFALFFFVYSSVTKEKIDLYVMYITEDPEVYTEKVNALESTLSLYTEDKTGDGEIVVFVDNIFIGDDHEDDVVYQNKERIMTALRAGSCMLILCDGVGLEYMTEAEALCDLSEEFPDIDLDGNYYTLNETSFMQKDTMVDWNNDLYISLRLYKGTVAELIPSSQVNFEHAKTTVSNVISDNVINIGDSNE